MEASYRGYSGGLGAEESKQVVGTKEVDPHPHYVPLEKTPLTWQFPQPEKSDGDMET